MLCVMFTGRIYYYYRIVQQADTAEHQIVFFILVFSLFLLNSFRFSSRIKFITFRSFAPVNPNTIGTILFDISIIEIFRLECMSQSLLRASAYKLCCLIDNWNRQLDDVDNETKKIFSPLLEGSHKIEQNFIFKSHVSWSQNHHQPK